MQNESTSIHNPSLSDVVTQMQRKEHEMSTQNPNFQGFRKRLKAQDVQSQRYECFCSNQYLSHTALYCHVKSKHPDYFIYNHGLSKGNLIQTYDAKYGYKIRKLFYQKNAYNPDISKYEKKPRIEMQMLKTPTQSATENLKAGYVLGKEQIWRIYQINQVKKLQDRIFQSKQCRDLQDKWLKIYSQKLEKLESIIANMSQIADYYQRILRIVNIGSIVHSLDNPIDPQDSDDSSLDS